jgi:methyl-accepting chemotaxis protein
MMQHFANLKIATKVLSLICLLGILSIAATIFATTKMGSIDARYGALLENSAKGVTFITRANTRLLDVGRITYMMVAEHEPDKVEKLSQELAATGDKFKQYIEVAKAKIPEKSAEFSQLSSNFDAILEILKEIKPLVIANDDSKTLVILQDKFLPLMAESRAKMNQLTEATTANVDQISRDTATVTNDTILFTYASVGGGLVLVLALAVYLTRRQVSRPIVELSEVMHRLAEHDYTVEVRGTERRDEVGLMAQSLTVFKDGMVRADQSAAEQLHERQEREARAQRIEKLAHDFDQSVSAMLKSVEKSADTMRVEASSMSATAEQTTTQATRVARAAEEASANVQTVAAATEELTASIKEIGHQVTQSAKVAANAVEQSDRTNALVTGLAQSAQRIGEVVNLINDVASQTNLLALNATIEAARAGEAGKGFAVVANEVKSLANQTGKATEEIALQINAVQSATTEAVQAIKAIGATISEISSIATMIASAVEQQEAATREIARNVQQAAAGTDQVTQNIGGVSNAATETGHSAHSVLDSVAGLSRETDSLRKEVVSFLTEVRAA